MTKQFSVIIPVYNAEKYLRRCLDSLYSQQHENAEIIMVNDGSSDGSGMICQEFAEADPAFLYYEKENGGVSSARNFGLDQAHGEYVLYVDSDDYVSDDFFLTISSVIADYPYDLVQFSNYFVKDKEQTERIREPFCATNRENAFPKLIEMLWRKKSNQPWAKAYKRAIIHEHSIRFPEYVEIGEDSAFLIHFSVYMQSLCVSERPVYSVSLENENSLSRKRRDDLEEQSEWWTAYVENAVQQSSIPPEEKNAYQTVFDYGQIREVYTFAKGLHLIGTPIPLRLKQIRAFCKQLNRKNLTFPNTRYCRLTSLPVRWNLPLVIDLMAWKLTH